jgi:hypothetical protein
MPFELGLTVGHTASNSRHTWFVFETRHWRLQKSLSDLNGTDPYVHEGTPRGVFRELSNAFIRQQAQPTIGEMVRIYEGLRSNVRTILTETGAGSLFEARPFKRLSVYASALADEIVNKWASAEEHPISITASSRTFFEVASSVHRLDIVGMIVSSASA